MVYSQIVRNRQRLLTESLDNPDYHLRIVINNHEVLDHYWDGTGSELVTGTIQTGVLQNGVNQISIEDK